MSTEFIRGELKSHSAYLLSSSAIEKEGFFPAEGIPTPLSRLQRTRLLTQEFSKSCFKQHPLQNGDVLDVHRFSLWTQVISAQLTRLARKVAKTERKILLGMLEQERLRKYLVLCWTQLKENFRKQYLAIKQNLEEVK